MLKVTLAGRGGVRNLLLGFFSRLWDPSPVPRWHSLNPHYGGPVSKLVVGIRTKVGLSHDIPKGGVWWRERSHTLIIFLLFSHYLGQTSHEIWPEESIQISGPGNYVDIPNPFYFSSSFSKILFQQLPPVTCWCCFSVLTSASPCLWHWGCQT